MVVSSSDAATGAEGSLFGGLVSVATEANTQSQATEAATFSILRARDQAGGLGTRTIQFRKGGANGNLVVSRGDAGTMEDITNTDVLSSADLYNLAFTDAIAGNPFYTYITVVVEFASGHGCFHGSSTFTGIIFDVASATRFVAINGDFAADGATTEANVATRNRAYTSWEAMQVRVTANARNNDSTFVNRIGLADGTGLITVATTQTGLFTDTAIGDAVADGDLLDVSLTLGTGVQDLTLSLVAATPKGSSKCDVVAASQVGVARTASATAHYVQLGGSFTSFNTTGTNQRTPAGFEGVASNVRCYITANTLTGTATLKLIKNGVAVITVNITAGAANQWFENTADSVTFVDGDTLCYEVDEGTSGSATFHMFAVTLDAAPVEEVRRQHPVISHQAIARAASW